MQREAKNAPICDFKLRMSDLDLPLLLGFKGKTIDKTDNSVEDAKDEHLFIDELVDGTLPAKEQTGEGKETGTGHLARVRDCHVAVEFEEVATQLLPQGSSHGYAARRQSRSRGEHQAG